MKPIRLQLPNKTVSGAERDLARYLPGLDVQLYEYRDGSVLLPPHLLLALEIEYGRAGANSILGDVGLVDGTPITWREVIKWGLINAEVWARRRSDTAPTGTDSALDWHLSMCHVAGAWQAVSGPDHIDWGDVRLGQIDTGYTRHPAFGFPDSPWIDVAGGRTFMPDPAPGGGQDTLTGPSGGHGTTSGSICCAHVVDVYYGVAPRVPLVPVRINDCVIIDKRAEEFEEAARYLVDEARVSVINVSLGTFLRFTPPAAIRRAVDHCYDNGVILVGAAGNVPAPDWPAYPAALPRAVAVAGVTRWALPSAGSSYGSWVDFSAPGKAVRRAVTQKGPVYHYTDAGEGTTFAAAMTSGAAALWLAAHGTAIKARFPMPWQRIEAFRYLARRTVTQPSGWNPDRGFGAGILDIGRLVRTTALPHVSELVSR